MTSPTLRSSACTNPLRTTPDKQIRWNGSACLSLGQLDQDTAVKRALNGVAERPHLSRLYLSYLSRFVPGDRTRDGKSSRSELDSPVLVLDYQRMYVLGALMGAAKIDKSTVNAALRLLSQSSVSQEVRALAAIFAARDRNASNSAEPFA